MGWLVKSALGAVWSVLGSLFGVKQAEVLARGQMAGAALETASREAEARASVQQSRIAAGWWWSDVPFMMVAGATAVYYVALIVDTLATGFFGPNSWSVPALPPPFDATMNELVLLTGGASVGLRGLGMILGRR